MDITYHYPPELFNLLVDALPRLNRAKPDVLLFFRGAGVGDAYTADIAEQLRIDRDSVKKYEMVRTVLQRLNDRGEAALRERREVLKRVVEWEDFSACWDNDRLEAIGLVESIRKLVQKKDAFTRMEQAKDEERKKRQAEHAAKLKAVQRKQDELESIKKDLCALLGETNPQKRGKSLEGILNRLFDTSGILVKESFTVESSDGSVVLEQIDGAIELDGHIYLVEMKWHKDPLGVELVTPHISRLFSRGEVRGIIISASGYTRPAIEACRGALSQKVVVLCTIQELVMLLERQTDLRKFLKEKTQAAVIEKNPFHEKLSQ
jgi:hypothetical protein